MDNDKVDCACLMSMAERELAAFMSAVTELCGLDQARIAAEDWIYTFESKDEQSGFTVGEWRKITIAVATCDSAC